MSDQPESDLIAEDFAAFWWAQESGETETWDELDADEREAVIENSGAEAVADWFAERMADMDRYVGKVDGYHADVSAEALTLDAAKRLCDAEGHDWGAWRNGARSALGTRSRYCQRACGEWETEPIPTKFPAGGESSRG